jgi:hypothetical protein
MPGGGFSCALAYQNVHYEPVETTCNDGYDNDCDGDAGLSVIVPLNVGPVTDYQWRVVSGGYDLAFVTPAGELFLQRFDTQFQPVGSRQKVSQVGFARSPALPAGDSGVIAWLEDAGATGPAVISIARWDGAAIVAWPGLPGPATLNFKSVGGNISAAQQPGAGSPIGLVFSGDGGYAFASTFDQTLTVFSAPVQLDPDGGTTATSVFAEDGGFFVVFNQAPSGAGVGLLTTDPTFASRAFARANTATALKVKAGAGANAFWKDAPGLKTASLGGGGTAGSSVVSLNAVAFDTAPMGSGNVVVWLTDGGVGRACYPAQMSMMGCLNSTNVFWPGGPNTDVRVGPIDGQLMSVVVSDVGLAARYVCGP